MIKTNSHQNIIILLTMIVSLSVAYLNWTDTKSENYKFLTSEELADNYCKSEESEKIPLCQKGININTSHIDDIKKLPGIGTKKAADIINFRKIHGSFSSIDQLQNIKGIGDKTIKKIRPYIKPL